MKQQTIALHYGYEKDQQKTMAVPIYQTTAYDFGTAEYAADSFELKHGPNTLYSRVGNPTTDVLEKRFAALEGGNAALALSSGMSAIFLSILNVADSGDNIIAAEKLYGGTVTLFDHTLRRLGIEVRHFDQNNPKQIESLIDQNTKAIYFETITNPAIDLPDFEALLSIAKEHEILTIVDNTVATPILCKPLELGADVVIHSLSKYSTGQGLTLGGIIVDGDQCTDLLTGNPRYPNFNTPDPAYHGLVFAEAAQGNLFTLRARLALMRDIGNVLTPFSSWLLIQGLETLSIRMREHSANALTIAKFLESHPKVKQVNYPGLKSSPRHALAQRYLPNGCSGLLSFEAESFEFAKEIQNKTKLFSIVTNVGDSKSIITHPASTTHQQLNEKDLKAAGISKGLIRLSVGLESVEDLINDLKQAMEG